MILCGDRAGKYGNVEGSGVGCTLGKTSGGGWKMQGGNNNYINVTIIDGA